jgi:hypothetical protein
MAGTGEESMEALVEFVGARLAEDRQWAHWATRDGQTEWFNRSLLRQPDSDQEIYTAAGVVALVGAPYGPHIARWDPQRVLDEVNAKGLLLERAAARFRVSEELGDAAVLRLLAAPYSGHADWQEEWQW